MLCNSYSNRFCEFYIFPIVGTGAINFQSKKQAIHPCFRVFFLSKSSGKNFYFHFHKLHNMTNVFVKKLCFYRARISIQSLFKTTPCPFKRQPENHTGVLASYSSHEYTVDRRSMRQIDNEQHNSHTDPCTGSNFSNFISSSPQRNLILRLSCRL